MVIYSRCTSPSVTFFISLFHFSFNTFFVFIHILRSSDFWKCIRLQNGYRKKNAKLVVNSLHTAAPLQSGWNTDLVWAQWSCFWVGWVGGRGGSAPGVWSCIDDTDSGMGHCRMLFSHSLLGRSQVEGKHLGRLTFTWKEKNRASGERFGLSGISVPGLDGKAGWQAGGEAAEHMATVS